MTFEPVRYIMQGGGADLAMARARMKSCARRTLKTFGLMRGCRELGTSGRGRRIGQRTRVAPFIRRTLTVMAMKLMPVMRSSRTTADMLLCWMPMPPAIMRQPVAAEYLSITIKTTVKRSAAISSALSHLRSLPVLPSRVKLYPYRMFVSKPNSELKTLLTLARI